MDGSLPIESQYAGGSVHDYGASTTYYGRISFLSGSCSWYSLFFQLSLALADVFFVCFELKDDKSGQLSSFSPIHITKP